MFIDLLEVPPAGRELDIAVPPEQCPIDGAELPMIGDLHLSGRIDHADDAAFRLSGSMSAAVELACVRCLEPFRLDLRELLDLLFLPPSANRSGDEEHELKDEDLSVSFYHEDKIDLSQLIREQLYLALPMKPICRADCAGLCPVCGVNRNLTRCDCARETVDPRLASLKALLKP